MGATIGNALVAAGHDVLWASDGRSDASRVRAERFHDVGTAAEVGARAEVVFSVVPPHAAGDTARALAGYAGIYVDANAIAPATAREVGSHFARFVDGGIIGGPPDPRLYVSGPEAETVTALFAGSPVEARVTSDASALKCAFAGWSKGSAALLLAMRAYAEKAGVWDDLAAEWPEQTHERLASAERSAERKGWRWIGEMHEIAAALEAEGLPPGFHEAAAEIYAIGRPTVIDARNDSGSSA
jgi:3-hydroxyisobutyrate dehydrogenase-like beta-hydroxyacid dehydrogenase